MHSQIERYVLSEADFTENKTVDYSTLHNKLQLKHATRRNTNRYIFSYIHVIYILANYQASGVNYHVAKLDISLVILFIDLLIL